MNLNNVYKDFVEFMLAIFSFTASVLLLNLIKVYIGIIVLLLSLIFYHIFKIVFRYIEKRFVKNAKSEIGEKQ